MSLSIGIIGLPNAGKSTLFNALASRRLAETAERPFTTIDPHEAVVPVHDEHFHRLVDLIKPDKSVPATVTFIDIAGLIKGAHKGEGLGNQFLGKIREVDAIIHVVRAFKNEKVTHVHTSHKPGTKEQVLEDIEIVNLELELGGIIKKRTLFVLNVSEESLSLSASLRKEVQKKFGGEVMAVAAKTEEDMIELDNEEKDEMFKILEWERSALDRLVLQAYKLLDLISFYTIKPSFATNFAKATKVKKASEGRGGGTIVSAWSLEKGSNALEAAEKVHTDFAKKFIKAEVVNVEKLLDIGSQVGDHGSVWIFAKERGLIRLEGKDYVVQDRDVIEFVIGK